MVFPKEQRIRILVVSILAMSVIAIPGLHAASEGFPADISGTWVSRVPGQGLNETIVPSLRAPVTTLYDVRLELNQSDDIAVGVLTLSDGDNMTVYTVNGTIRGSEFTMTSFRTYLVDDYYVRNVTATCDLEIDGKAMLGEGLLYVGTALIPDGTWRFDLVREDEFDLVPLGVTLAFVTAVSVFIAMRKIREKRS